MPASAKACADALSAAGPAADRGARTDRHVSLIGPWALEVTEFGEDVATLRCPGDWHFS